ncbi:MAG: ribokinase, partial [Clostridiales bacterium]|nr:ribokinase [Clostridiales bacterium]
IGSLNTDLTLTLPRFHEPGETITATSFQTYPGGKGGNQAVAAKKLGAQVLMVGKLGDDQNGDFYEGVLKTTEIPLEGIERISGETSGMALIEVDAKGENRIAIVPGTNALVDKEQVDSLYEKLLEYDLFLFQLEIPMETVSYAMEKLHRAGKTIILDPAPAVPLPKEMYPWIDYITPNRGELALLTGMEVESSQQVVAAAKTLLSKGVGQVVAKLGAKGCLSVGKEGSIEGAGFQVDTVDTTAAGDSFNAGLAVALALGKKGQEALTFANGVAALSTTGAGAQGAMPTMEEVERFLETRKEK